MHKMLTVLFWVGCHSTILNSKTKFKDINKLLSNSTYAVEKILTRVELKIRRENIFFTYHVHACISMLVHQNNTSLYYPVYSKVYMNLSLHSEWINCYNFEVNRMLREFMLMSRGLFLHFCMCGFFNDQIFFMSLALAKCIILVQQFTL